MVRNPIDPPARIEPGVCLADFWMDEVVGKEKLPFHVQSFLTCILYIHY